MGIQMVRNFHDGEVVSMANFNGFTVTHRE